MKIKKVLLLLGLSVLLIGCNKNNTTSTEPKTSTSNIEADKDETTVETEDKSNDNTSNTTYIHEMDEMFSIPSLPIVYEDEKISLAQYEKITMPDLPEYKYSYEDVKAYVDSTTQKYISQIGENAETYELSEELIASLTFDETTTYEGMIDYYYNTYNNNLETQRIDNLKNGCMYAVAKNSKIDESSSEWRNFYNEYKNEYDSNILEDYDSVQDYLEENGISEKYYNEHLYNEALISYKENIIVDIISNLKGYNKTETEAQKEIEEHCEKMGLTSDEYEELFGDIEFYIQNFKYNKVKDYIYSQTTFEDIYIDSLEELGYDEEILK